MLQGYENQKCWDLKLLVKRTHCSVLAKESKGKTLGFVFRQNQIQSPVVPWGALVLVIQNVVNETNFPEWNEIMFESAYWSVPSNRVFSFQKSDRKKMKCQIYLVGMEKTEGSAW